MQRYCVCYMSQTQCLSVLTQIVFVIGYSIHYIVLGSITVLKQLLPMKEASVSYCASIFSVICLQVNYVLVVTVWDYTCRTLVFFPLSLNSSAIP